MQKLIWEGAGEGTYENPFKLLTRNTNSEFDFKDAFNIFFEGNYVGFKQEDEVYIVIGERSTRYLLANMREQGNVLSIVSEGAVYQTLFLTDMVDVTDGPYFIAVLGGISYIIKQQIFNESSGSGDSSRYKGVWKPGAYYELEDLVIFNSELYMNIIEGTQDSFSISNWEEIAKRDPDIDTFKNKLLERSGLGWYVPHDDTKLDEDKYDQDIETLDNIIPRFSIGNDEPDAVGNDHFWFDTDEDEPIVADTTVLDLEEEPFNTDGDSIVDLGFAPFILVD